MIHKLLCWLGWHEFRHAQFTDQLIHTMCLNGKKLCKHCGKVK